MVRHRKSATAMTAPRPRSRQPKQLDAGIFQAEISSFRLYLAQDNRRWMVRLLGRYSDACARNQYRVLQ